MDVIPAHTHAEVEARSAWVSKAPLWMGSGRWSRRCGWAGDRRSRTITGFATVNPVAARELGRAITHLR